MGEDPTTYVKLPHVIKVSMEYAKVQSEGRMVTNDEELTHVGKHPALKRAFLF